MSVPSSRCADPAKLWPLTTLRYDPCGSSLDAVWDVVACTPGVNSSKAVKRRFRMGRLATVFSLKVVATSLRSVFNSGVPAVTSTVSLSSPSCSLTSRLVSWSTETLTSCTYARKLLGFHAHLVSPGDQESLREEA